MASVCLALGCSVAPSLRVDLRTDLLPGEEFDRVVLTGAPGEPIVLDANLAGDYVRGEVLTSFVTAEGPLRLTAELRLGDELGVARSVEVQVRGGDNVVTIVASRDCRGVMCPAGGDIQSVTCLGGRCVDPTCTPETPEFCPPEDQCASDDECPGSECATGTCRDGTCLQPLDVDACDSPFICVPSVGCECEGSDSDTLFLFDFEQPEDALGRAMRLENAERVEVEDAPCGAQVMRTSEGGGYGVIEDDESFQTLELGSLDLWIRFSEIDGEVGLLSRDALNREEPGHMTWFRASSGQIAARFQGLDAVDDAYACTPPIVDQEWHHVAVNFGDGGFEIYLDGVLSTAMDTVDILDGTATCNRIDSELRPSIAGNRNPFVIGASAHVTDNGAGEPVTMRARGFEFDHVRLSSVRRVFSRE